MNRKQFTYLIAALVLLGRRKIEGEAGFRILEPAMNIMMAHGHVTPLINIDIRFFE